MIDLYDELEEFREFLVRLHREMQDEPASWAVDSIQNFMDNNSDTWYGGDGDHWRRHMQA